MTSIYRHWYGVVAVTVLFALLTGLLPVFDGWVVAFLGGAVLLILLFGFAFNLQHRYPILPPALLWVGGTFLLLMLLLPYLSLYSVGVMIAGVWASTLIATLSVWQPRLPLLNPLAMVAGMVWGVASGQWLDPNSIGAWLTAGLASVAVLSILRHLPRLAPVTPDGSHGDVPLHDALTASTVLTLLCYLIWGLAVV